MLKWLFFKKHLSRCRRESKNFPTEFHFIFVHHWICPATKLSDSHLQRKWWSDKFGCLLCGAGQRLGLGQMWFATRGSISICDGLKWGSISVADGLPVSSLLKSKLTNTAMSGFCRMPRARWFLFWQQALKKFAGAAIWNKSPAFHCLWSNLHSERCSSFHRDK